MTIKDIAQKSGYAVGTVSRVLNGQRDVSEQARATIMAVVKETGFTPNDNARHLKQRGGRDVAILVKGTGNMLFAGILEEMQARIKAKGGAAVVYYLDEDDDEVEQAIRVCRELKPLGILFLGGNQENFQLKFDRIDTPSVLVTTRADGMGFPNLSSVSTDDTEGAARAVGLLLEQGHENIGVIGGRIGGGNTSETRLEGCKFCFARHGKLFDEERRFVATRFSMEGGYEGAMALLERSPDLTAIFAMADVQALGAIRALRDKGLRVPEDVSVVGYDGIELGEYSVPRLTTIRQHSVQLARRSVEILLKQTAAEGGATHEIVPFELVPGESAAPYIIRR